MLLMLAFAGCWKPNRPPERKDNTGEKQQLRQINRYLVDKDEEKIAILVEEKGWIMEKSESGLWYMIYEQGEGVRVTEGAVVEIGFRISLLDGTLCYSSDEDGDRVFEVGAGLVEQGLDEGVELLREGDKARLIMPPHLAFGLLGDEKRVPARSILLYEIEILHVH